METPATTAPVSLTRIKQVCARVGWSKSSIYAAIAEGKFPRQISLGARSTAWLSTDIDQWIADRVAQSRRPAPEANKEPPKAHKPPQPTKRAA
ncbi:MAG: helix-turn-helix transcriptional regulator [Terracidiphilus sp.]